MLGIARNPFRTTALCTQIGINQSTSQGSCPDNTVGYRVPYGVHIQGLQEAWCDILIGVLCWLTGKNRCPNVDPGLQAEMG